jgi:hypothetical protein
MVARSGGRAEISKVSLTNKQQHEVVVSVGQAIMEGGIGHEFDDLDFTSRL